MPAISGRRRHRLLIAASCGALVAGAGTAAAQDAAYFSPTYAASRGSPYSEIYASTFGAGIPDAPLETAAPAVAAQSPAAAPAVVYVIEGGLLLTYSAGDYARGGQALAGSALPAAPSGGRLYGAVAPPPGAPAPLPLLPRN